MIHLKKIIYRTEEQMYLMFTDNDIRVLKKEVFYDLPDWQVDIIEKNWNKAYVDEFGGLSFNKKFDIGGDTLKNDTKSVDENELFRLISKKRIAKKRIIQALASLL